MLTYTSSRNLYGKFTNNTTSANLTNGDTYRNQAERRILGARDWPFLEKSDTSQTTVASQQFYPLPNDFQKSIDVTVTVGQVLWHPTEVVNRDIWDRLNYALNVTASFPQKYYIYNGQMGFWPKPTTDGYTITYNYKKQVKDLTIADVTTGSIVTATNNGTLVVGSGTSWTAGMKGMFLQITDGTSANLGDGFWYEISSVINGTNIALVKPYQGVSITAGTGTYTIGQASSLPENYQIMPVYYAAAEYWRIQGNNIAKAKEYERLYAEMLDQFEKDFGTKSANPLLDKGVGDIPIVNPNLTITL